MDAPVRHRAVEARHHRGHPVGEQLAQHAVGLLAVQHALGVELHGLRRVQEPPAQVIRQEQTVQVLAPGGAVVRAGATGDVLVHLVQGRAQVAMKPQLLGDVHVPSRDQVEGVLVVLPRAALPVAAVEQVGHLIVILEAAAGGRGYHVHPGRIHRQDGLDLGKLACIRQRAAAELCHNLLQNSLPPPSGQRSGLCRPLASGNLPPAAESRSRWRCPEAPVVQSTRKMHRNQKIIPPRSLSVNGRTPLFTKKTDYVPLRRARMTTSR